MAQGFRLKVLGFGPSEADLRFMRMDTKTPNTGRHG